jgi:hypothetical protein
MTKRGQAALEFLSTYGFAFLIILVMIGALSYFGVLSPQRLVPGRCTTSPEFDCADYQVLRTGVAPVGSATVNMILENNQGVSVEIETANDILTAGQFVAAAGTGACAFVPGNGVTLSGTVYTLPPGSRLTVNCGTAAAGLGGTGGATPGTNNWPPVGDKAEAVYNFNFRQVGDTFWKPASVELLATVA